MEGEGVRQRKGRRDQESQIENGDVVERETHRGKKKTDRGLFIIVKLQTDEGG